jgi:hypothetical protein
LKREPQKAPKTSAAGVLAALRAGPFPAAAFAWLYEVSNATGWGRKRYADALVLQCWPSRGIFLTGIEVKVDRYDWARELRNPEKAEEIQQWCSYFYLAAPPGVVNLDEVPKAWGLYVVDGKKATRVKEAPEQKPKPLTRAFVASILRNFSGQLDAARQEGKDAAVEAAQAEYDVDAVAKVREELTAAKLELARVTHQLEYKTADYDNLVKGVRAFEQDAGLPEHSITAHRTWGHESCGAQFKAALLLAERPPAVLAKHFRDVADALDVVATRTKGVA